MRRPHLGSTHERGRLVGFTDAVVGVALTMLVLPMTEIVIPLGPEFPENPVAFVLEHKPERLTEIAAS